MGFIIKYIWLYYKYKMSGQFTRKMYDDCYYKQNVKQITDPLELVLDVNKYVNYNNICKPQINKPRNAADLVDIESSLWGIDKIASNCDTAKHPNCSSMGCLLTNDPRIPVNNTPYLCERGKPGDVGAVVTTNMQMPNNPGYQLPNPNICHTNTVPSLIPPRNKHNPQIYNNTVNNNMISSMSGRCGRRSDRCNC